MPYKIMEFSHNEEVAGSTFPSFIATMQDSDSMALTILALSLPRGLIVFVLVPLMHFFKHSSLTTSLMAKYRRTQDF